MKGAIKVLLAAPRDPAIGYLGRFLRDNGIEVAEASDGGAALSDALLGKPDAIILDLSVGVIPPEKLVTILRANPGLRDIPLFYLGEGDEIPPWVLADRGEYVPKPIREEGLLRDLRRALFHGPASGKCAFLPEPDAALLRKRLEGECGQGGEKIGRVVFFIPDPSLQEGIAAALADFREFEADDSMLAQDGKAGSRHGLFGRVCAGEGAFLNLYSFPYIKSTASVWYATAPRPVGIIVFLAEGMPDSLDGLLAAAEYARGPETSDVLAVTGREFPDFGLGENTARLFRSRIEKLGCLLKVREGVEPSPGEIRDSLVHLVRSYIEGGAP